MEIKYIYKKLQLLFFYLFCISSCAQVEMDKKWILSDLELKALLSLLGTEEKTLLNYHVLYSEQFNDSTGIVEICQNNIVPSEEWGICKTLRFKKSKVFVYDTGSCTKDSSSIKVSSAQGSPYYIPDAPYWEVLIKRRKGQAMFSQITLFERYVDQKELVEAPF